MITIPPLPKISISEVPEMLKMFDFEKNDRDPNLLSYTTMIELFWVCGEGHRYKSRACDLKVRGFTCRICKPHHNVSLGFNDLKTLYPEIANNYDEQKNKIPLKEIHKGSKKRVWWLCSEGHSYDREVYVEVRYKGNCPVCSGARFISGGNDLKTMHPETSKMWSPNNSTRASEVASISSTKYLWICSSGHEFLRAVRRQVSNEYQKSCPKCPIPIPYETSVASSDFLMKIWDQSNSSKPKDLKKNSHRIVKWFFEDCSHSFKRAVKEMNKTYGKCFECNETQEDVLDRYIIETFKVKTVRNKRILKDSNSSREIDILIPELSKGIEFNGEIWHSDEKLRDTEFGSGKDFHIWKFNKAKEIGIDLKFVWAHDWTKHREAVFKELESWMNNNQSETPYLDRLTSIFNEAPHCGCDQIEEKPDWLNT